MSRKIWLVPGAATTVIVLVVAGAAFWTFFAPRHTDGAQHTYHRPIDRLTVDLNAGDITVLTGTDPTVSVGRRLTWTTIIAPTLKETWSGDTLAVDGGCPRTALTFGVARACVTALTVRVPAGTGIDVHTETGTVTVDGAVGSLRVRVGSGDIGGTTLGPGAVDVAIGAGDVHLGFVRPAGTVTAAAGDGDISVVLAAGRYDVTAGTGSGDRTVDVTQDPHAPYTVTAHTGHGDIHVAYAA